MTQHLELYRCPICGNIVQILQNGNGQLVCCGKNMELLKPHTIEEEKQEKHVPIFDKNKIKIGSEAHPMINEHYIQFIQAISNNEKEIITKFLNPEDEPEMHIPEGKYNKAIEYCNIHGLWKS